ncbi:glycosyltransferase involved in cell wall biosynthesis [Roseimicrobium gellanilyticum]|uniref:Glycosyltransferase involved in cell wall biosynthesis n=1 Tax=Roseimicrobium gellanilyticum TaxID=748857 RepID=A0A366HBK0_9BACT|nr:glycosyltransferase family 4 protein [Roseimicrobium gellanilyticum]RBP39686.1 glycosyltransferase involved in cell wall biosynthesis [Roseimicrobium gellanilyticum]
MSRYHLAYIFERFPTFTQTFCVREILELERMGVRPLIFSIHDTRDEKVRHYPEELLQRVHFLPPEEELIAKVLKWKEANELPQSVVLTLRHWGDRPDKNRVYEAAYISHVLTQLGSAAPSHTHSHFAGMGARTCWWLRKFHGTSFSFTAHANDIFCCGETQIPPLSSLFREASLVVTVSDYTARKLKEEFPIDAPRVQRVYNGLDLQPFVDARAGADRTKAAGGILSVGRLIEKKGYDDLITACGLLRDRDIPFHCRIVGEGPLEDELKSQISNLKLTDRVTLTGPLGMTEIIRLLAEETQVFALACKTEKDGGKDNLPTVLMEAMAASLPCVSTRLAGVPEMVVDGVTGLLCDEKQPAAFADHLVTLLQDPLRCEQMGKAGLTHARKHFAKEETSVNLLDAFAERASLRFDLTLAQKYGLLTSFASRTMRGDAQLRHHAAKARDKSFDLARFMDCT